MAVLPSRSPGDVQFQVLGARDDLQIRRGIVERVLVDMVNVLGRLKLAAKHLFHDKPVFRLVVPVADADVLVPVLDVFASKDALAFWRSVALLQRVVILAKALCNGRVFAALDGALIRKAIDLLRNPRIAMPVPAVVVGSAHAIAYAGLAAAVDGAKGFLFGHSESIKGVTYGVN